MTPKERRGRLFRRDRPEIRPVKLEDMRWMWAAYRQVAADPMTQDEFREYIIVELSQYSIVLMAEDWNRQFQSGRGPIGVFTVSRDEWTVEPHVSWFHWATPKNMLRTVVAYLWEQRTSYDVGTVRIHCNDDNKSFFDRMRNYVPLYRVGKIPFGRPNGDDFIYYLRGKKRQWAS